MDYLNSFTDMSELIESAKAAEAIRFVYTMCAYYISTNKDMYDIFEEKNTLQLHFNIHEHYSLICETLKCSKSEGYSYLDSQKTEILLDSLNQLNFLTLYSVKFRLKYFEQGGAKALINLLKNENFSKNFQNSEIYSRIVANINWLSKNADLYKSEWNELNASEVLLKVSRNVPSAKAIAYMTFANIGKFLLTTVISQITEN